MIFINEAKRDKAKGIRVWGGGGRPGVLTKPFSPPRFRFIERAKIKDILKPKRLRAQRFLRHKSHTKSHKIILALSGQTKHH